MQSAMATPINRIRFQFHKHDLTRSVKRVRYGNAGEDQPNAPHAATMSG